VVVIRLVEKNQNYIMDITGMTHEGQGVGKVNGFTVFVEGAIEGESVEVKIIKVAKNYGVGKLVNILKPSGERTSPFCKVYKRCGGCSLQHADYGYQLRFKTDVVRESLKRIGKLEDVTVHPTIGMQEPFRYRNKAQYPIAQINGKPAIGLYARRSHDVVEFEECSIQDVISDRVRSIVREFIADNRISIHNESSGKGIIRHVMTRIGFKTGEVMVVIVINGNDLPARQDLIDRLISNVKGIKSIILNINTKNTNVVLGEKNKTIYGDDTINDYIGKYVFKISALSFFQVNPVQTEILYNKALEYAALTGNETVFDLYSGIGTISLFLSEHAGKTITLDVPAMAVEGRTMVPLRFISESLGASVQWSGKLRRIDITADHIPPAQRSLSQVMVNISVDDEGQVHPDIRKTAGRNDDTYSYYLKLMDQPKLAGKTVGIVYDYVGMRVVDGPVEKDGITWWKLEGHGKSGWADERCLTELEGEWNSQVESAIAWAIENIGKTDYNYRCLGFVQDAYKNGGLTLAGAPLGTAKKAATAFKAEANKDKIVPRGAAVFYNWEGTLGNTTQNWGHVGIALQTGKYDEIDVINALDYVCVESGGYLAHAMNMDYIGWAWIFKKN
jgi:23S rRNA (uracil1939-C5)-methyltransferase